MITPLLLVAAFASPSATAGEQQNAAQPVNQSTSQDQKTGAEIRISSSPVRILIGDEPNPSQVESRAAKTPSDEDANTAINRSIRNATIAMAVFTFLLVVVGVGQGIVYGLTLRQISRQSGAIDRQACIAADTLAANHEIERAYVTLSHYPPGIEIENTVNTTDVLTTAALGQENPRTQAVKMAVRVQNYGNTPARVTAVVLQPHIGHSLPGAGRYDEEIEFTYERRIDVSLVRGDSFTVSKEWNLPDVSITDIQSLGNATSTTPTHLWILGYVDYIDKFGKRHRSGYARIYDPGVDRKTYAKKTQFPLKPAFKTDGSTSDLRERLGIDDEAWQSRNNLPFVTVPGYNYDRVREKGEGDDWDDPQQ